MFEEKGTGDSRDQEKFIDENAEAAFYSGKIQSAKFFISAILPVTVGKIEAIKWDDISPWEIREQSFGG
jgi:hypothetical protein